MSWLITTFQSPSAWKALVSFAMAGGIALDQDQANAIVGFGLAVMGILNSWKHAKENKS